MVPSILHLEISVVAPDLAEGRSSGLIDIATIKGIRTELGGPREAIVDEVSDNYVIIGIEGVFEPILIPVSDP